TARDFLQYLCPFARCRRRAVGLVGLAATSGIFIALFRCLRACSSGPLPAIRIASWHARLIGLETSLQSDLQRTLVPPHGALQPRLRGEALQLAQRAGEPAQRQPALPFRLDNVRA